MCFFLFVSLKRSGGDDGLSIAQASRFGPLNLGDTGAVYACAFLVLVLATWCLAQLRAAPFGMVLRPARQNPRRVATVGLPVRSEEHTSELQSLMRISYAVFCLKKKKTKQITT